MQQQRGPDYRRLLQERKKTAKDKSMTYHGLTRRIVEIWPEKPLYCSKYAKTEKLWCGYRDAKAHGNAVDCELSEYAKLGQAGFIQQRGSGVVDPCSLAVISWLRSRNFTPLLSQYVMYDSSNGVKTHLDLLAEDENHKLVLIELKATIEGSHESYRGMDHTTALAAALQKLYAAVDTRFVLAGRESHVMYRDAVRNFIEAYDGLHSSELLQRKQAALAAQAVFVQDLDELYPAEKKGSKRIQKWSSTTQTRLAQLSLLHLGAPAAAAERTTLPNSYYVRHMIQLVMMLKILHLRYGILVGRGYILRVGGGNLWCYPMDSNVLAVHQPIYDSFCSSSSSSSSDAS